MRLPSNHLAPARIDAKLGRAIAVRAVQLLFQQALTAVIFFASAGTWRWWRGWLYFGLSFFVVLCTAIYVLPRNPEVIAERGKLHKGSARFDKIFLGIYTALLAAAIVVAGLDAVRFGWALLGPVWAVAGALLLSIGMVPVAWAMAVNRHLEPLVRIQQDRGHHVVTTGPYRSIRHPMYFGLILQIAAEPMVLGSAWAFVPSFAAIVSVIVRTALEDRTLQRDLPGYADYARRTRYRLLPGLW
jgi:protein-S-isoprenylcysteine O-methyltransferase Ste14